MWNPPSGTPAAGAGIATLRVGLVLGIGAEWMELWEEDAQRGGNRVLDPAQDFASTLERVHRALEFTGPALNLSAACASSNFALEIGRTWLRLGLVDLCVAGGCEMAVTPIGLATFGNLRALCAGMMTLARPRARSIAAGTVSSWAKGAWPSCSSAPRMPGGGRRGPTRKWLAAGPAAMRTIT